MAEEFGGWLCAADPNWLELLKGRPELKQIVHFEGPKRPSKYLPRGAHFVCVRKSEAPRRIHLIARFDGSKVLTLADAWDEYELKLGVPSRADFLALRGGPGDTVCCHLLSDIRFLDSPVLLSTTGVSLLGPTPNNGRYLSPVAVAQIRAHLSLPPSPTAGGAGPGDADAEQEYPEGRERLLLHRRKERNRKAVERKKAEVLATRGKLLCEACDFDFAETYGGLGKGAAECHHRVPMAKLTEEHRLRLSELAIVCANCHRILHRPPHHTVEELRRLVTAIRAGKGAVTSAG